ncbi:MAG: PAS domain S-box protein, partial [Bacillota bacterium]
ILTSFNLEKEYEIVFNNTQDALFIVKVTEDNNFRFLKLNPTHENLTGLKTEKIKGKTPEAVLGKEAGKVVANKYRKCLEKKDTFSYEEVLDLPSGKKYWATKLSPVIEDGEVTHIVGSSRNITKRKKLQKQKDEINERYKLATNVGGIGVWKLFLENNELIWDREMKNIYGFSHKKNDIEYEDWVHSIHPEDRERVNKDFNKAVENKGKFSNEFKIETSTGEVKYIRAFGQVVTDDKGKSVQVIGVNYDITERKLYEKRYKTLFDESLFGVALIDPKTAQAVEFNETLCNMLGYNREEFADLSISDYETKENEEEIKERVERMLNGSKEKFETKHRKKDGTIIDVLIKASMVILNGEKYIHVMYMDITERKRALEKLEEYSNEMEIKNMELEQAKRKAQEASKAKSEFLANMSHEIRTPMNSIIGMADLLLETDLSSTQKEYIEILENAGENLLNIINDILDISKIESGKIELEKEDFNLHQALENVAEIMSVRAFKKGLEFPLRIAPNVPTFLKGDSSRLRQILINFIGNAIKFTEKGQVVVEVELEQYTKVEGKEGVELAFHVIDTGIGIEKENQKKIFSSFSQADSSSTRKYGGTGLGLSISKQLVEMMGGNIELESSPGEGSTFSFTALFPLSDKKIENSILDNKLEILEDLKILAIDDNETNLFILEEMFADKGAQITSTQELNMADNFIEKSIKNNSPYDLILLDNFMPKKNGYEFAREIENKYDLKDTKIIMLSSDFNNKKIEKEAIDYFMRKPIRKTKLFSLIHQILEEKESFKFNNNKEIKKDEIEKEIKDKTKNEKKTHKILVAEDNQDNQILVKMYLNKEGYNFDLVENGKEAVDKYKEDNYSLILMDIQMPKMDGYEATSIIRNWETEKNKKEIPIVALTAYALDSDKDKILSSGFNDHLGK